MNVQSFQVLVPLTSPFDFLTKKVTFPGVLSLYVSKLKFWSIKIMRAGF